MKPQVIVGRQHDASSQLSCSFKHQAVRLQAIQSQRIVMPMPFQSAQGHQGQGHVFQRTP